MQPAAQRVAATDRSGLARQDEERRLEGVLDVVLVPQDGAAGGRDHRPVPRHQGGEGRPVAVGGIAGQELTVAQADGRPDSEEVAQVSQGRPRCHDVGHDSSASPIASIFRHVAQAFQPDWLTCRNNEGADDRRLPTSSEITREANATGKVTKAPGDRPVRNDARRMGRYNGSDDDT